MYDMLWHLVNPVLAVEALITVGKALMCKIIPSYHSIFPGETACDKVAESLINLIAGVDFICFGVVFLTIIKFV